MKNARFVALASAVAVLAASAAASAYPGQRLAPQAKITLQHARALALRTVHGTIVSEELEKERGGSGLRYTFDVKAKSGVREVGVDAKTGAVLENSADNGSD